MNPYTPRNLPAPAFEGVKENSVARCYLERDWNYHMLTLEISETGTGAAATDAALLALVKEIRLKVNNGKPRRVGTAVEFNAMNARHNRGSASYGLVSNGGASGARKIWLPIYFYAPWLEDVDPEAASALCWDARLLSKFTLEVEFGASTNPGVSVPNVTAMIRADKAPRAAQGVVQVWEKTQLTLSGAAQDVPNFSFSEGFFQSLSITNPAAGAFTKVQLYLEDEELFNKSDTTMATDLALNEKTRQTGRFDLFLDYMQDVRRAPGVGPNVKTKLHVECGAAMASTDCIIESLQPLLN